MIWEIGGKWQGGSITQIWKQWAFKTKLLLEVRKLLRLLIGQGLKRAGNSVLRGQLSSCISHALLQDVQKKGKCVLVKKQWKRGGTWGEDVTGNRRQSRHTMEETPGSWVTGTHKIPASQNTHRSHESPSRAEALSDAPSPYFQGMDHHLYVCSEHLFRNIR